MKIPNHDQKLFISDSLRNPATIEFPNLKEGQSKEHFHRWIHQIVLGHYNHEGYESLAEEIQRSTMVPPYGMNNGTLLRDLLLDGLKYRYEKARNLEIQSLSTVPMDLKFETRYVVTHKAACICSAFSRDGRFLATGSADKMMKILDVEKMRYSNQFKADASDSEQITPSVRQYHDHSQDINDICFHPSQSVVASGSSDGTIKFFDFSKGNQKRAQDYIQEKHSVLSLDYHPTGNFMLVGCDHHILRLYDLSSKKCYISSNAQDHHRGAVNQVRWAPDGKIWVSCSSDGTIKIWDGQTGTNVFTLDHAHGQGEVFTVHFSLNSKYLISSGSDQKVRLWDLSTKKQCREYRGLHLSQQQCRTSSAVLSFDEQLIYGCFDQALSVWDTKSGQLLQNLTGHTNTILSVSSSPKHTTFASCSEDGRCRLWCDV